MEALTLDYFVGYGIFGVLFGFLFIYTIKKNDEREQRYLEIIDNYSQSVETLSQSLKANTLAIDRLADELDDKKGGN